MSVIWVIVLLVAAAVALFGRRHAAAAPARPPRVTAPARASARAAHLDHADFSEETLPAVLPRSAQWDDH